MNRHGGEAANKAHPNPWVTTSGSFASGNWGIATVPYCSGQSPNSEGGMGRFATRPELNCRQTVTWNGPLLTGPTTRRPGSEKPASLPASGLIL